MDPRKSLLDPFGSVLDHCGSVLDPLGSVVDGNNNLYSRHAQATGTDATWYTSYAID